MLDKPVGITSTHAVARLKRIYNGKKAGHAGTLDPLASGILPIAFGEATKTVPYVQDGEKGYRFTVLWGVETNTDDADGTPVATSEIVPERAAIEALLPRFIGVVEQRPPAFSAIKIAGERAYDLARDGQVVEIAPRAVTIHELVVSAHGVRPPPSRRAAARAPTSAPSPVTSDARWAATATSPRCAAPASAPSSRPTASRSTRSRRPKPRSPRCAASRPGSAS